MKNLIITKMNGDTYDLMELGIITKRFRPSSPQLRHETESIGDGEIKLDSYYEPRDIKGSFFMRSRDYYDYSLMLSEVYRLFQSKEEFYVVDSDQPGKRWKVQSEGSFSPARIGNNGDFDVNFISFSPFAESIGTTLDPLTFDAELWQIGQGLTSEDTKYTHTTSLFSIYNAGDEKIDPRYMPLLITYTGDSTNLKIKNNTTGDEWTHTGTSNSTDTIKLDGVRSTKNGLSIFRDTNHKLITLAPGMNEFELTGATSLFTISFDFRFHYI